MSYTIQPFKTEGLLGNAIVSGRNLGRDTRVRCCFLDIRAMLNAMLWLTTIC